MNKIIACIFVISVGACASDEANRRETATARDATHRHHDHERVTGEPADLDHKHHAHDRVARDEPSAVKPVAIAGAPARDADGRVDESHVTAADQGKQPSDTEVTRRIRKAVSSDDKLTTDAKNVKIVTQDGRVTLRGNVTNDREKTAVEGYAREVAGASNVDNQLVIH